MEQRKSSRLAWKRRTVSPRCAPRPARRTFIHSKSTGAFTILELLVCLAVVSLLFGLVFPALQQARECSRRVQCASNMRQISLALHERHLTRDSLPAGWASAEPSTAAARSGRNRPSSRNTAWGWAVDLLPYLELQSLYNVVDRSGDLTGEATLSVRSVTPPVLVCPSDSAALVFSLYSEQADNTARSGPGDSSGEVELTTLPRCNYVGIFGVSDPDESGSGDGEGTFVANRPLRFRDLTRGLSNVAYVGERTARRLPATWLGVDLRGEDAPSRLTGFALLGPNRPDADECELDSRHNGFINMAFADGHVRQIADNIDQIVYQTMARRSE